MTSVPGYVLDEALTQASSTVLVRGRSLADGAPVLIKLLREETPSPWDVALLRREYEVACSIEAEGVLRPRELVRAGASLALVFEDFGGRPLRDLLLEEPPELEAALEIALAAARTLGDIHRHQVIHKNVTPASLLVDAEGRVARVIDFSICTRLAREAVQREGSPVIEGQLPYVSPEQTGRMNRSVDSRTDLYSLGVTLYEMLTGRVPFESADPLELVHCHIARRPVPPDEVDASIPAAVSRLVMKLLAKRAEDRYQSAGGLAADLETFLARLRAGEELTDISLGARDVSGQLEIPEKLYGREQELEALMASFDEVGRGRTELFLVGGYSGVGKSALVHELHEPIVERRGVFVSGKFDQFKRDSPYRALIQALSQVVQRILTDSEAEVSAWSRRLEPVLGENGRLLTDLIPGLELIVGPQPEVQELPPTEAQNRFKLLLEEFVRAFATDEHPLVLFLDDLQWADSATLGLLKAFLLDGTPRPMLLLGAYRDNEVDLHHPLMLHLRDVEEGGGVLRRLTLAPLGEEHLGDLVADTLQVEAAKAAPLTRLLHDKTGGNPFHVTQFLRSLHEQGLLALNAETQAWTWDLERIEAREMTSNVVDLMVQKLQRLEPRTQRVLQLAACIGNRFSLEVLAVVNEASEECTAAEIWEAVREGLVLPLGTSYKLLAEAELEEEHAEGVLDPELLQVEYRFLHDRVQQAADALIAEDERQATHLRIGRLLRDSEGAELRDERLFDVVGHLNLAAPLVEADGERQQLAELNLEAGRRAIQSSAYEPAAAFLRAGLELLPADAWSARYELALGLHTAACEAESMRLEHERGRELGDQVLAHARTPLECVGIYELRIQHAIAAGQLEQSIDDAIEALGTLGVHVPRRPTTAQVLLAFLRMRLRLRGKSTEDLRELPTMTDPEKVAAMSLLVRVSPAAYQSSPNVLAMIICKEMDLILRHGNSDHSAQAYCSWAVLLCEILGDVRGTYAYGKLGVEVAHRCPHKDVQARSIFYFTAFHQHWAEPQRDSDALLTSYQPGFLEGGDLQFFGYAVYFPPLLTFYAGGELAPLVPRFEQASAMLGKLELESMNSSCRIVHQAVRNLAGLEEVPSRLAGAVFDTSESLQELIEIRNGSSVFFASLMELQLAYLFGDHERAAVHGERAVQNLDAIMSTVFIPQTRLYEALNLAALARRARGGRRRAYLRRARRNLRRLRHWAAANPQNFRNKALLVEAELASVRGRDAAAERAFERAAEEAQHQGFVHEEALARERAGLHYLERGRETLAATYLREALMAYGAWGARSKVSALRREHADLLGVEVATGLGSSVLQPEQRAHAAQHLDLESVLRASRVISGEIVLDRLLGRLLEIVIQNAGAERGVLIRVEPGGAVVLAEGTGGTVELVSREPIELGKRASPAIVNLVVRTGEPIVLEDASSEKTFQEDAYVRERAPRSVLAVPASSQGQVTSVIYVENNLTVGAFTPERVEVLQMLASQASISLENAELYANLTTLNRAYERFVPRAFLRYLAKDSIVDVELGDSVEREFSVLFADIRSFTSLSERLSPGEAFGFINSYLGRMEPVVERHGGFIDKYQGDAILALFERSAADPVRAAIEMQAELLELNRERGERGEEPIRIGIGIHSGRAMLGTVGGHRRMDGTVIGDTVNLASRLESLTKEYGTSVLLSGATLERLEDPEAFETRWLGQVQVKGKDEHVDLHELLDGLPPKILQARRATRESLRRGLEAMREGRRNQAVEDFERGRERDPSDPVFGLLVERAKERG